MQKVKDRRTRIGVACNLCRLKKNKCDGLIPCAYCQRHGKECVFRPQTKSPANAGGYSILYVRELEKSLERAEAALHAAGVSPLDGLERTAPPNRNASPEPSPEVQTESDNVAEPQPPARQPKEENVDSSPDEIMDINDGSGRFEYHGQISSLAFLDRLIKIKDQISHGKATNQVISEFQNEDFSKQREIVGTTDPNAEIEYYPFHAFLFIDSYFKTIHYVYPIIDQDVFLSRCHILWAGNNFQFSRAFQALYFAVLALGALTRPWTEGLLNGMDRYTWTRVLFERAELLMGRPGSLNNLEGVQSAIILAQICQHQLNPNLAYTYLGIAIRTVFSTGMNRLTLFRNHSFPQDSPKFVVSRTWWALYSLETELSLALGRPDVLGSDSVHNRPPPSLGETEYAIIPAMLGLSKILRAISKNIYWDPARLLEKLRFAGKYEKELDQWVTQLPAKIRPVADSKTTNVSLTMNDHYWPKLDMLVLRLRFLHARLILFYLFFIHEQKQPRDQTVQPNLKIYANHCVEAATDIIKTIHHTYCTHHFFRSWWNNATYITFGLSILLSTFARETLEARLNSPLLQYINQALEVLEVMYECSVARNIHTFAREIVDLLLAKGSNGEHRISDQIERDGTQFSIDGFDLESFNFFDPNLPTLFGDGGPAGGIGAIHGFPGGNSERIE